MRRWNCIVLLVASLFYTKQLLAAWQQPLSEDEVARVAAIIVSSDSSLNGELLQGLATPRTDTKLRSALGGVDNGLLRHPLGTQILLVELKEQKKQSEQPRRLAEVFIYDYQRGVTELSVIDVEQERVIRKQTIATAHLPLVETEIDYVQQRIWNNAEISQRLQQEMHSSGGVAISGSSLSRLQTRVSIWVPTNPAQSGASNCVDERCALTSIFTEDNYNFSLEPVVNLMSGEIYLDLVQ